MTAHIEEPVDKGGSAEPPRCPMPEELCSITIDVGPQIDTSVTGTGSVTAMMSSGSLVMIATRP